MLPVLSQCLASRRLLFKECYLARQSVPNSIQQGRPQPVVLAGNGTVNAGSDEARRQPLPGIENEDTEDAIRAPGSIWKNADGN